MSLSYKTQDSRSKSIESEGLEGLEGLEVLEELKGLEEWDTSLWDNC